MGETLATDARTQSSGGLVKIAVIGAGAMGSVFGSAFAQAGFATTLVDVRSDVVDAIRSSGVTVHRDGTSRQVRLDATTDPSTIGTVDLVLFVVKSYHTAQAAR
jgi:2-dehydropantoate 2-reductase